MARKTDRIPVWIILLDAFGMLLIALGIFGLVASGDGMLAGLRYVRELAIVLIITGALCATPLIVHVIQRAASARQA